METIEIREARAQDAEALLAYVKRIGGESDNLTFDGNGFPITVEQEQRFLENVHSDPGSIHLIALKDGKIIADGSLSGFPRRMSHRADLGISVVRDEWNHGIGSMLMERLIDFAKDSGIELINLEVRADNESAIHLYEKYGFRSIGTSPAYFKIGEQYFDFVLMVLDLRTDRYAVRRLTEELSIRPLQYQDINAATIDRWIEEGWEWGKPITHEAYLKAKEGEWDVLLTPTKPVPHEWFGDLRGKKILGLASGGGQQMPIFAALGAACTVLDYSSKQIESERIVAEREGYQIRIIQGDMTKPLPFEDEEFDLVFHPVSNCYVEEVRPIWKECYRVLKHGGYLIAGTDHYINYIVDSDEKSIVNSLPFNPLKNPEQMKQLQDEDAGVQFSHSLEEQIGGQLEAGFRLLSLYEDTNGEGRLHELRIPTFIAMRSMKN